MNQRNFSVCSAVAITCAALLVPALAGADTASEVKAVVEQSNAYTIANLSAEKDDVSKHGALEFWSSGGLLQRVSNADPQQKFTAFSLTTKHIEVITLVENQAAVAMYYSEGSMQPVGSSAVSHYLTRVTEVFVKEGDTWKRRAAHFSPITGGQGTSQTAVQ